MKTCKQRPPTALLGNKTGEKAEKRSFRLHCTFPESVFDEINKLAIEYDVTPQTIVLIMVKKNLNKNQDKRQIF